MIITSKNIIVLVTLVVQFMVASLAFAYDMEDLKALIQQKSYHEAIMHLDDIAPKNRNTPWEKIREEAILGQSKVYQETNSCMYAHEFVFSFLENYANLKENKKILNEFSETGICVLEKEYNRDWFDLGERIVNIDPRESTLYQLATKTHYDKGFVELIEKNPSKYKNDTNVHAYLYKTINRNTKFDSPYGKRLKKIVLNYGFAKKSPYKEKITKSLLEDMDKSIKRAGSISMSKGDENLLFLARHYQLLSTEKLQQFAMLREGAWFDYIYVYKNNYKDSKEVHASLVRNWKRKKVNWEKMQELVLFFDICKDKKLAHELVRSDYYLKELEKSKENGGSPGIYGRPSQDIDVNNLKLAQKCGALTKNQIQEYYFFMYVFGNPITNRGENKVFVEAIATMQALSAARKKALSKMITTKKYTNMFDYYDNLKDGKKIKEYIAIFPTLEGIVKSDCKKLRSPSTSMQERRNLAISSQNVCALL